MEAIFVLLFAGLGHDDFQVRKFSYESLHILNVQCDGLLGFDTVHYLSLGIATTNDLEKRDLGRRLLRRYLAVQPTHADYYPKMKFVPVPIEVYECLMYQQALMMSKSCVFSDADEEDRWHRWCTFQYVENIMRARLRKHLDVKRTLDAAVEAEKKSGEKVLTKTFNWDLSQR